MLENPHGPGTPAQKSGHLLHAQPANHPEKNDFGLLGGEKLGDATSGLLPPKVSHDLVLDRNCGGQGEGDVVAPKIDRTATDSAAVVSQAPAGHREHQGAEVVLPAGEAGQTASHFEPSLGGDVLTVLRRLGLQETQKAGLERPVEHGHGPLGAGLGRGENILETLSDPLDARRSTHQRGIGTRNLRLECGVAVGAFPVGNRSAFLGGRADRVAGPGWAEPLSGGWLRRP